MTSRPVPGTPTGPAGPPGPARPAHPARPGSGARGADPFAILGLPRQPGLSDDEVRAAWRRIAAATHPDREDGGDPEEFAAAAAAYTALRTRFGRGEVFADLAAGSAPGGGSGRRAGVTGRFSWIGSWSAARFAARVRGGRPRRLALRVLAAAVASAAAVAAAGLHPAAPALVTGALTWLGCTARRDLAVEPSAGVRADGDRPGGVGDPGRP